MRKFFPLLLMAMVVGSVFGQTKSGTTNEQQKIQKPTNTTQLVKSEIWSDDFEDGSASDWTMYDQDGDSFNWGLAEYTSPVASSCLSSASWDQGAGALNPENWAVTPAIDLTSVADAVFLGFNTWAQDQGWTSEHYKVMVSTTGDAVADFTDNIFEETLPGTGVFDRSVSLSDYTGETIYLAFVHYDCSDMFMLNLDDLIVYTSTEADMGITAVVAPTNESSCTLSAAEDITITLFNNGGIDATGFDVSYTIDGGTPVVEVFTETLLSGANIDFTFSTPADFSALAYYHIEFEVSIENDANDDNNTAITEVRNTDGELVVRAQTDSQGEQEWTLTNMNDEVVGHFLDYQWDILVETSVCVLDDDCYTFEFTGFDNTGWVELVYNGNVVAGGEEPGNTEGGVTWIGIGGACAAVDAKLNAITTPEYSLPGNVDITGELLNAGADNITSFDVVYTIDGGAESTVYSVTGVNISSSSTYDFTHDVSYDFTADGAYVIAMTISNVNNDADDNVANNSLSKEITISSTQLQRITLWEQFTTEQCPNCPPVLTAMEAHMDNNPNFIMMVHHAGFYTDYLTIPESEEMIEFYGGGSYAPAGMADRHFYSDVDGDGPIFFPGNGVGEAKVDNRTAIPAYASVGINGENNSGELSLTVGGEFLADFTHDLGVSLWITEDNLDGSGQSGASGWIHRYSVRDVISARLGDAISTSTAQGDVYSKTYTFNLNASWDINELYLVATVNNMSDNDINDREILNAIQVKLSDLQTVSLSEIQKNAIIVYPNPAKDVINIKNAENSIIEIYNIAGELVINTTETRVDISKLANGTYIVKVITESNIMTEKINISH